MKTVKSQVLNTYKTMERKMQLLSKHTLFLTTHKARLLCCDPLLMKVSRRTSYHRTLNLEAGIVPRSSLPPRQFLTSL